MRRRRRRFFRDEVLAPWVSLGVILGFWWLSALVIGRDSESTTAIRVDRPAATAPAATSPAAAPSAETATPPPTARAAVPVPSDDTARSPAVPSIGADISDDVRALRGKDLLVPVNGMKASSLHSTFGDPRGGDTRAHEALDILAPRGTPVVAATDGRIVKLFTSERGGLTVYQFDPDERFCYYYAHLDRYAPDLVEGHTVTRGQTIGFVGVTGNAAPDAPHLHFAINRLGPDKKWWEGEPIDPYLAFTAQPVDRE
jgi:murein DD-endopeptidase MepM/ murein hydrolase activator NlpD